MRHLLAQGVAVAAVARPGELHAVPAATWHDVELLDQEQVSNLIQTARPDAVFHLAGQASVQYSWQEPVETFRINVEVFINLVESLRACSLDTTILVVGSNEVYGAVRPEELPTSETAAFRPENPYAASKAAQDLMALQYFLGRNTRTVRVRPFTHIGPGQRPDFAIASFAQQIAAIEAGLHEPVIKVGNLDAERDITDVRDMVRAYHLAVQRGEPGEVYNVGRGTAYRIHDLLDLLLAQAQIPIRVEVDPDRLRPTDTPVTLCDCTRFQARTGWQPAISMNQTLEDILNYWRETFARAEHP